MQIPRRVIDEIIEKTEIVDIVSNYVSLEKKGKDFYGICPFHNDNNPSMSVSPGKRFFKCFSCGAKGDVIRFVSDFENIPFVRAAKKLADLANIDFPFDDQSVEVQSNARYYKIMAEAVNFYRFYLENTMDGKNALSYLNKRGIDEDIIRTFSIGLSSTEMDYLTKALTRNDYTMVDQLELGLIKSSGSNYYDTFRERIMFPIEDHEGNTVGFSGRIYTNKENEPKYVNSPESVIFHKSRVLYNFHRAMPHIRKSNKVFIFEGFMDVIAAHRAQVMNAVATMGTAMTLDHAKAIKKLTNNAILCFDGDEAGLMATKRAIPILRSSQINIEAVLLPDKLDPDDFLKRYGAKALNDYLETKAVSVVEFLYRVSQQKLIIEDVSSVERHKTEVYSILKTANSAVVTEIYLKKLAADLSVQYETLEMDYRRTDVPYHVSSIVPPDSTTPAEPSEKAVIGRVFMNAEKTLIQHMLFSKEYAQHIIAQLGVNYVTQSGIDIMCTIRDEHVKTQGIGYSALVEQVYSKLSRMEREYMDEILMLPPLKEGNLKAVDDCLNQIINVYPKVSEYDEIKKKLNLTEDPDEMKNLSEKYIFLKKDVIRK